VPAGRRARRRFYPHVRLARKPQAPCHPGQLADPSPRHHEASDGNGAFARTVSAIPGPSTRMAAATSATSRVSMNATLSSPACPPRLAARAGGSRCGPCPRARARPRHRSRRPTPGAGPGTGPTAAGSPGTPGTPPRSAPSPTGRDQFRSRPLPRCHRHPHPAGRRSAGAAARSRQRPQAAAAWPAPSRPRPSPRPRRLERFLTLLSGGLWLTGAYALGPEAGEWLQQAMPSGVTSRSSRCAMSSSCSPPSRGLRRRSGGGAQRDHGRAAPGRCWCPVTCGGGPHLCPGCGAGE
jgi:hypothetical protein